MTAPSAQLTAVLSLAAALSQIACEHAYQPGSDDGAGGTTATGGTGGLGGTGPSGVGATGATPPCPEYPDASRCGEGGCEVGDSFPSGTGGGVGEECLFVIYEGPTGACEPSEARMGPCNETFCQGGAYLTWYLECP